MQLALRSVPLAAHMGYTRLVLYRRDKAGENAQGAGPPCVSTFANTEILDCSFCVEHRTHDYVRKPFGTRNGCTCVEQTVVSMLTADACVILRCRRLFGNLGAGCRLGDMDIPGKSETNIYPNALGSKFPGCRYSWSPGATGNGYAWVPGVPVPEGKLRRE